jgi:hypothetical protein
MSTTKYLEILSKFTGKALKLMVCDVRKPKNKGNPDSN